MSVSEEEFDRILTRAAQPLKPKHEKDAPGRADDCNDTQIHQHSSEDNEG